MDVVQVVSTFVALQRKGVPSQLVTFPDEVLTRTPEHEP